jgi:SAM-dependent methyltransferase
VTDRPTLTVLCLGALLMACPPAPQESESAGSAPAPHVDPHASADARAGGAAGGDGADATGSEAGEERGAHGHHGHHGAHGQHGNPEDLQGYVDAMMDPERAAWQQPEQVVAALKLEHGGTVCDVGAGPGYFTLRLAQAVGAEGRVYAVDVEPRILADLVRRIGEGQLRTIVPVLGLPEDPLLPAGECDLILVVNTYHHFPDGPAYLRRLGRSLAPGGRIVNIDFHKRELPVGPPPDHKISRDAFVQHAAAAGLQVAAEHDFLEHQYFLELKPTA